MGFTGAHAAMSRIQATPGLVRTLSTSFRLPTKPAYIANLITRYFKEAGERAGPPRAAAAAVYRA